jgi:hypothetical protein
LRHSAQLSWLYSKAIRSSKNLKEEVDISTVVDNLDYVDKDMVAAFQKDLRLRAKIDKPHVCVAF